MTILKFILERVGIWLRHQLHAIYERVRSWFVASYQKRRNPDDDDSSS